MSSLSERANIFLKNVKGNRTDKEKLAALARDDIVVNALTYIAETPSKTNLSEQLPLFQSIEYLLRNRIELPNASDIFTQAERLLALCEADDDLDELHDVLDQILLNKTNIKTPPPPPQVPDCQKLFDINFELQRTRKLISEENAKFDAECKQLEEEKKNLETKLFIANSELEELVMFLGDDDDQYEADDEEEEYQNEEEYEEEEFDDGDFEDTPVCIFIRFHILHSFHIRDSFIGPQDNDLHHHFYRIVFLVCIFSHRLTGVVSESILTQLMYLLARISVCPPTIFHLFLFSEYLVFGSRVIQTVSRELQRATEPVTSL